MSRVQDADVLSSPAEPHLTRLRPFAAAFAVVLVLDQVTKEWALRALADGPNDVFGGLRWRLVFNPGASFSTGTGFGPWLGVLAIVMVGVLIWMVRDTDPIGALLFGSIAGGAVGNFADRLFRSDDGFLGGEVVDFIDFGWWPVFNIADIGIVGGVILFAARALLFGDRGVPPAAETAAPVGEAEGLDAGEPT